MTHQVHLKCIFLVITYILCSMCKRLRYKKRKKTLHFEYLIILKHLPRYLSYELTKQFIGERSLFAYDTTWIYVLNEINARGKRKVIGEFFCNIPNLNFINFSKKLSRCYRFFIFFSSKGSFTVVLILFQPLLYLSFGKKDCSK